MKTTAMISISFHILFKNTNKCRSFCDMISIKSFIKFSLFSITYSVKKAFLKRRRNSQANTCARVFFCRPQDCYFIKKEVLAQVFSLEHCNSFKNTYLEQHLRTAASAAWERFLNDDGTIFHMSRIQCKRIQCRKSSNIFLRTSMKMSENINIKNLCWSSYLVSKQLAALLKMSSTTSVFWNFVT